MNEKKKHLKNSMYELKKSNKKGVNMCYANQQRDTFIVKDKCAFKLKIIISISLCSICLY